MRRIIFWIIIFICLTLVSVINAFYIHFSPINWVVTQVKNLVTMPDNSEFWGSKGDVVKKIENNFNTETETSAPPEEQNPSKVVPVAQPKQGSAGPSSPVTPISPIKSTAPSQPSSAPPQTPVAPIGPVAFSGSLNLSQNSAYVSQKIIVPQINFKLADFTLINNTTESVDIKKIRVDLYLGSNPYTASPYLSNLYVMYDESKTLAPSILNSNLLDVNYQLSSGKSANLTVYGDINSSIPLGSIIIAKVLVSGISAVSNINVVTNSNAVLAGQSTTISLASLVVVKDNSSPSTQIFTAGQRILAGKFKITATADSYNLSELKFIIPNLNGKVGINKVFLFEDGSSAEKANADINNNYYDINSGTTYSTFGFEINTDILKNSSKTFSIYYDMVSSGNFSVSNMSLAPALIYIKAKNSKDVIFSGSASNYQNMLASSGNEISIPSYGITTNNFYVFKSVPTFAYRGTNSSAINDSVTDLYKFNVSADATGSISIKQVKFQIKITSLNNGVPALNNFKLYKGDSDYTNSVSIGNVTDYGYIELESNGAIGIGATNNVVVTFTSEEIIPAGKTQEYTLKAKTNRFINSSTLGADYITTTFASDSSKVADGNSYLGAVYSGVYFGLKQTRQTDLSATAYNIIWSDRSATDHNDSSSYSSGDWYNGYKISIPSASQKISAK